MNPSKSALHAALPPTTGIGKRRTFSDRDYRHLPDLLSAFAGPFSDDRFVELALLGHKAIAPPCSTKLIAK